jgi:hypothetical protein
LAADPISTLPFLIVPVVMAVIGYQFMKRMAFNPVDEVFDVGDALLVRSGGQEERVALADIKNVNFFPYMSPPQVTLSGARACSATRLCSVRQPGYCPCCETQRSKS